MDVNPQPHAGDWGPCPGPEVLAAWLDGDRRRDLTEHLLGCVDCRADALAAESTRWEHSIDFALQRLAHEPEASSHAGPCPSPVVVASWTADTRSPDLLEHWADCALCRADLLAAAQVGLDLALEDVLSAQPWRDAPPLAGPCPSPDAVAVRVEAGDLAGIEDHLAACAPCRADALAAVDVLAAERAAPRVEVAAPEVEVEPELAKILSFSRRSRRVRRIVPTRHARPASAFAPAVAIAAAVMLAVFVFALRPRPRADLVAANDIDNSRFAWAPEEDLTPRPAAAKRSTSPEPAAPTPEDDAWEAETDFEESSWVAWAPVSRGLSEAGHPNGPPAPATPSEPPIEENSFADKDDGAPTPPPPVELAEAPEPVTPPPAEPQRIRTKPVRTPELEREPEAELAKGPRAEARGVRVRRSGKRLPEVDRFRPGDRIFASRSGGAVRSVDGLTLYLAPRSEVHWRADGVELVRGRAFVQAADVRVTTKAGPVDVSGDVLLAVKGRQAGVQVVAGSASYAHPKGNLAIEPGRSAVVSRRRGAQVQPAVPQAPKWLSQLKGKLSEPLPVGLGGKAPVGGFPAGAAPGGGVRPPPGGTTPPPTGPGAIPPPNTGAGRPPAGQPAGPRGPSGQDAPPSKPRDENSGRPRDGRPRDGGSGRRPQGGKGSQPQGDRGRPPQDGRSAPPRDGRSGQRPPQGGQRDGRSGQRPPKGSQGAPRGGQPSGPPAGGTPPQRGVR